LATGLAQKTPQVTLRHLEHQALSLADCQKIATEMLEGEAILAEADGTRKRLRTLLALVDAKSISDSTAAAAGTSPAISTPRQHTTWVGERNPTRDPVGVTRSTPEEHTP
jgi:hypothetical protein